MKSRCRPASAAGTRPRPSPGTACRLDFGEKPRPRARGDLRLGVLIGQVDSAYELYAGGIPIGGVGRLSGPGTAAEPSFDYDRYGIYPVPGKALAADGSLVLALRVLKAPATRSRIGGPVEGPSSPVRSRS